MRTVAHKPMCALRHQAAWHIHLLQPTATAEETSGRRRLFRPYMHFKHVASWMQSSEREEKTYDET